MSRNAWALRDIPRNRLRRGPLFLFIYFFQKAQQVMFCMSSYMKMYNTHEDVQHEDVQHDPPLFKGSKTDDPPHFCPAPLFLLTSPSHT